MNRPDNMLVYDEIDLKLGIKSSLPHVKRTLALAVLFWESADHPAELPFSKTEGNGIIVSETLEQELTDYLNDICTEENITQEQFIKTINENQLFKSQLEALIVAFELVWKIAKVEFVDTNKASSAERTGGIRYPKKLNYSVNIDIIHSVVASNEDTYKRILMAWAGFSVNTDPEYEENLMYLLAAISEGAIFKLSDGEREIKFNQNSIYRKLLETNDVVDISGDKESKGSLRILKSLLPDGLNPYLTYNSGSVTAAPFTKERLEDYQKRVDTFLRLSATKVIGLESEEANQESNTPENELEQRRVPTGANILLYGVPGSGKSWTIQHEYCSDETRMERLVFHPDYTYSDFVGQILPDVSEGLVTYKFTPGPFTTIMKKAYENPEQEFFLVIEEINRGNAPAIFGEVFQLLDRKTSSDSEDNYPIGTSEYGISNPNIARIVYGDPTHKVRIPSNLSIIGTMNTSDQNVFTLDTAFQRRWSMRMIDSTFDNVAEEFKNKKILDTEITWEGFCEGINTTILTKNVRITSSEDKRMGPYFIHMSDLEYDAREDDETLPESERLKARQHNSLFAEKVIKYLWDDAFKFARADIFDTANFISLEHIIKRFSSNRGNDRFCMFKDDIITLFENPFLN